MLFTYVNFFIFAAFTFLSAFVSQFFANPTERLGRNAKIRSNKVLGNTLYKLGIPLRKFQISRFGIFGSSHRNAVMKVGNGILQQYPEKTVIQGEGIA